MYGALVAELDDRVALIRIDAALVERQRFEMLDLPGLPWFADARRRRNVIVRRQPAQSGIEVYKRGQRVDLGRREARVRSVGGRSRA